MTSFTRTWDAAYKAVPADTDVISEGAQRIRHLKEDISERAAVDHSWAGDTEDGKHSKVTLRVQASVTEEADAGILYSKDASGKAELHYKDEDANEIQLTSGGAINVSALLQAVQDVVNPIGTIRMDCHETADTGWLECDGSTIGDASSGADHASDNYETLFGLLNNIRWDNPGSAVWASHGTVKLPNLSGRVPIGRGTGTAGDATAHTIGEQPTSGAGGEENHTIALAELPPHTHEFGHASASLGTPSAISSVMYPTGVNLVKETGDGTNGAVVAATLDNDPANIMQPHAVLAFFIRAQSYTA